MKPFSPFFLICSGSKKLCCHLMAILKTLPFLNLYFFIIHSFNSTLLKKNKDNFYIRTNCLTFMEQITVLITLLQYIMWGNPQGQVFNLFDFLNPLCVPALSQFSPIFLTPLTLYNINRWPLIFPSFTVPLQI